MFDLQPGTYEAFALTPEIVQRWLDHQVLPFAAGEERISEYVQAMRAGLFRPDSVVWFYSCGALHDGIHRLTAVARSGVPIVVSVVVHDFPLVLGMG